MSSFSQYCDGFIWCFACLNEGAFARAPINARQSRRKKKRGFLLRNVHFHVILSRYRFSSLHYSFEIQTKFFMLTLRFKKCGNIAHTLKETLVSHTEPNHVMALLNDGICICRIIVFDTWFLIMDIFFLLMHPILWDTFTRVTIHFSCGFLFLVRVQQQQPKYSRAQITLMAYKRAQYLPLGIIYVFHFNNLYTTFACNSSLPWNFCQCDY